MVAIAEINIESSPAETPVINQVAVFVPFGKLSKLTVGDSTEKVPLSELKVTVTPDNVEYRFELTEFSIIIETVFVSPTFMVEGNWFALSASSRSKY